MQQPSSSLKFLFLQMLAAEFGVMIILRRFIPTQAIILHQVTEKKSAFIPELHILS